jgi:MFS family permease
VGSSPVISASADDRLFTGRFFVMCLFTFTVFLSAFQLFPTAPFRIRDLGGSNVTAGLFLGILTFASALSAPITGGIADRIGKRKMLLVCSAALVFFALAYSVSPNTEILLILALVHGFFWSGLLSASSAYITDIIPAHRRAEGIGYWGMSSILSIALAPPLGLWLYQFGWIWLCTSIAAMNALMAFIAFRLPETHAGGRQPFRLPSFRSAVEWRVLALSLALFLYAVGHGGITSFSAMYTHALGIEPIGLFFTVQAGFMLATRPFSGLVADRLGYRMVLIPCFLLIASGMGLLAMTTTTGMLVAAAACYGVGVGNVYPVYAAYIIQHMPAERRGAAFGSILAAFDTGIGSGSMLTGFLIEHFGYPVAFGSGAVLAVFAVPYFLYVEPRLGFGGTEDSKRSRKALPQRH